MPDLSRTLYVTANSPGEISGFLAPIVAAARRRFPEVRVAVVLLPCTFATGREEAVARAIPGVDEVYSTARLMGLIRHGPPTPALALFHLGGDLMYAALVARRWRVKTWAYQWAQRKWDRHLAGYCVKTAADAERLRAQGIGPDRIHVVGDLIVDAVQSRLPFELFQPTGRADGGPHVVFMPGSRTIELQGLTPFFLAVADCLRAARPDARFSLLVSPYLDPGAVHTLVQHAPDAKLGGVAGRLAEPEVLVSAAGTRLELAAEDGLERLARADVAVTIPGTKTGEAGTVGTPMLVLLPYNRPDLAPHHGVLGLLDWVPLVGRPLKGWLLEMLVGPVLRHRLLAQPNLLAGQEVVPELKGHLVPEQVAERVLSLIDEIPRTGAGAAAADPAAHGIRWPAASAGDSGVNASGLWSSAAIRVRLRELYAPFRGASDRVMAVLAAGVGESRL